MLATLIVSLIGLAALGFMIFHFGSFALSVNSSSTAIERDIQELKDVAYGNDEELTPLNTEELSLMAHNVISDKLNKNLYYTEKGTVHTVYEECILSYAYKRYNNAKSVLVAVTEQSEYVYLQRAGSTKLSINNYQMGNFNPEGRLIGNEGNSLGQIIQESPNQGMEVDIKGNRVASMIDLTEEYSDNTRLFNKLESLEEEDRNIFTALVIYEILMK